MPELIVRHKDGSELSRRAPWTPRLPLISSASPLVSHVDACVLSTSQPPTHAGTFWTRAAGR